MSSENGKPIYACPNCGKPGKHFVPPSFGEQGFYVCDEKQELIEVPVKFLDKTNSTVEALCARIAELESMQPFVELAKYRTHIVELKADNKRLRECISAFLLDATPWLDISGIMYNRDLADCAARRLRNAVGEG